MPLFSKGMGKENHYFRIIHEHSLNTTPGWKYSKFSNANNPDEGVVNVVGLPEPVGGLDTGSGTGYQIDWVAWSGDGDKVALCNRDTSNISRIDVLNYSKDTDTFSLRYTISPALGRGSRVSWDPTGTYLFAGFATLPYARIWTIGDSTATSLSLGTAPGGNCIWGSWNSDGTSIAMVNGSQVQVYNRSGSSFSLAATITPSLGTLTCAQFSPDGTKLAIVGPTSPKFKVYNRTGDTFDTTGVSTPTLVSTAINWLAWNEAGDKIAIGTSSSPVLIVITRSGNTYTQQSNTFFAGTSPNTRHVGWAGNTTLFASFNNNVAKAVQWYTMNPNGVGFVSSGTFAGTGNVQTPGNFNIYREPG